jgi:hypothetical protein
MRGVGLGASELFQRSLAALQAVFDEPILVLFALYKQGLASFEVKSALLQFGREMKAVILAGGLGTRFAEETDVIPKPMIEIGAMPIIWRILKTQRSAACGF